MYSIIFPCFHDHFLLRSTYSATLSRIALCLLTLASSTIAVSLPLSPKRLSLPPITYLSHSPRSRFHCATLQLHPLVTHLSICRPLRNLLPTRSFDGDSFDIPMLDDGNADDNESLAYVLSSSDGEDSYGKIFLTPVNDVDLPSFSASNNDGITVAAHRFATLGKEHKKHRTKLGFSITVGLIIVLTSLLLYVDWCAWRIVRLPLSPFYLTRPFLISAILVSFAGYVCVPIFCHIKIIHVIKKQGPARHQMKKRTPTLDGLLFYTYWCSCCSHICWFLIHRSVWGSWCNCCICCSWFT